MLKEDIFILELASYAAIHASGKSCGQNGPKIIAPSIFGQLSKMMSGFFPYSM